MFFELENQRSPKNSGLHFIHQFQSYSRSALVPTLLRLIYG